MRLPLLKDPGEIASALLARARALGFSAAGLVDAAPLASHDRYRAWVAAGHAGDMEYMTEPASVAARADLAALLPEVASALVVALPYGRLPLPPAHTGRVAAYAQGEDYHLVMKTRLHRLGRELPALAGRPVAWRVCVDTAPVLERELAARAGLGFVGKNTALIAPGAGSAFLLGELLMDLPLAPVAAGADTSMRCGRCTECIDRCPTGALGERTLDARLCISYLTIEWTGIIPLALRPLIGTWVYGCDICQDVCPFNEGAGAAARDPELAPRARLTAIDLPRLIGIGTAQHRKLVRRTALRRAPREQLQRNACVAAGNVTDPAARPALVEALSAAVLGGHPLVRGHAAWALGRLSQAPGDPAARALTTAREKEDDPWIVRELMLASGQREDRNEH